ncbi:MAG TPA: M10 family metallopeptidase C-terminal domain-containing protein [Rhizomicrobium sp.]|jgi:hypothetical protein
MTRQHADAFESNDLDIAHRVDDGLDDSWTFAKPFAPIAALHARHEGLDSYAIKHQLANLPMLEHHHDSGDSMPQAHLAGGAVLTGGSGTTQSTSPTMAQETAFISGIDASGKTVATSFWTWNNNNPASYAVRSDDHKWGSSTSHTAGGTVTYYFDTASSWTATEKAQMTACLTLWSDIANINFSLTSVAAGADITFHRGNDGSAVTPAGWSGSGSAGNAGGSTLWTMTNAEVSIDTSVPGFGPMDGDFQSIGGYVWMTIEHELGHAIGLGHGGPYNGDVDESVQQYSAFDTRLWSIMSYIEPDLSDAKYFSQYTVTGTNWGTAPDGYGNDPTTPMPLDIAAIQGLYGVSTSAAYSGGQVFGFNTNIADVTAEFYDFTKNVDPVVTLFDSGTGNRLDLSGYSTASVIDLNPGTFSSADGMINNIGIAFGTKIDQAIGGAGADTFYANADADYMVGGAGADTFNMGADFRRDDRIVGGGNRNTVTVDGDYHAIMHFESDTVRQVGTLVMAAGHDYSFITADRNVAAGQSMTFDASTLGSANEFKFNGIHELDGSLIVIGGAGSDVVYGGTGNDIFTGNGGQDHYKGDGGADTYVYKLASDSTSTTHDLVFDFDAANDKIDLPFAPSSFAVLNGGSLTGGHFDDFLTAAVPNLANHQAILFTPDHGNLAGHSILVVDFNGQTGYQAGADLAIDLNTVANIGSFSIHSFV